MSLEVAELSTHDDEHLISFLDSLAKESGSVLAYHYPFYRKMLEKLGIGRPLYLGARRSGQLCGYLPAFLKQTEQGSVVCSLPYFGPNAGVLSSSEGRAEIHTMLLKKLLRMAEDANALSCSVYTPFLFEEFEPYASAFGQCVVVEKFNQYLEIERAQWSGDIERKLRRAQRVPVRVTCDVTEERLATFYEIYRQNCADYGIPQKPWECIKFLAARELLGKFTQIYFAMINDQVVAGLLILLSPVTASYYIPCTLEKYRSDQPGTLIVDQAIKDVRARGLRYWNWESSPGRESGVYMFKQRFGSHEGQYRIYVRSFRPEEEFKRIGRDRIAEEFPYYFVWPFDRL
jgi:hypothetical protein